MVVVAISELDERGPQFFEIAEAADPQDLFYEGAKEALDASIALGLAHESWGWLDSQELDLGLEVVAHVHAAVVVAQLQAFGGGGRESPEVFPDALADRFEGPRTG